MSNAPRILAFAGSLRRDSWNKKLVKIAAEGARAAGAEVAFLDLRDVAMPLYDADLEKSEGLPAGAKKFKELMLAHHGLLIASPEYNSSISGVLKNAIDWASRPAPGEPPLACFNDKVAGLMAASPGKLGGLRGLVTLRSILSNINVLVIPGQVTLGNAHEAFGEDGRLKDAKQQAAVEKIGASVAHLIARLCLTG
jgi:chromate reductase, NAD(P)H dehydrogenase (quinone)